jgi:hypothetical protein
VENRKSRVIGHFEKILPVAGEGMLPYAGTFCQGIKRKQIPKLNAVQNSCMHHVHPAESNKAIF